MAKRRSNEFGDLLDIPGVGKSLAGDLRLLGITDVASLRGTDPEAMFMRLCSLRGRQDRCVLYVFRCAVYFAETAQPEPEKLKWWNWKD
ncbi:MAG: helix-hairpin-helix domain-containing protein [Chitinivorax sp.]